jgi:hypothetical protein
MSTLAGIILCAGVPLFAALMVVLEDRRIADERKAAKQS